MTNLLQGPKFKNNWITTLISIILTTTLLLINTAQARCYVPESHWQVSRPLVTQTVPLPSRVSSYHVQRYSGSCVFAAFASVTGVSEQSLIDGYKLSGFGIDATPETHGVDSGLFVKWLNTQGHHFENVLWFEYATCSNPDWRSLAQETDLKGVVTARGHAWMFVSADETGMLVWDPLGHYVELPYAGTTGLFLPVQGGFEDHSGQIDHDAIPPSPNKVTTSLRLQD